MQLNDGGAGTRWGLATKVYGDITVLFADKHPLTLSGLKSAVAAQPDIRVLIDCMDRERLSASVRSQSPHVLFVSSEFLQNELADLFQLVTENEGTKVILLTNRSDPDFFEDALRCGASGIFERERPVEYIPKAIRRVMDGGFWFEQSLAERMLGSILHKNNKQSDPEKSKIAAITARDRQVLGLICKGMRNKGIAERLRVSETTVSRQVTAMFRKLEVGDRTSLAIYAIKRQLVSV